MSKLPPLPEPDDTDDCTYAGHSDDQLRSYGQACWEAAIEAAAKAAAEKVLAFRDSWEDEDDEVLAALRAALSPEKERT